MKKLYTLIFFLTSLLSGCGSLLPGSSSKDEELRNSATYYTTSESCKNLDLSTTEFTAPGLRNFVGCLNSNGQIPAMEHLLRVSSDEELEPIGRYLTKVFFSKPRRMFEIHKTLEQLRSQNELQDSFEHLSRFLENPRFITALVQASSQYFHENGVPDEKILKALKLWAPHLQATDFRNILDALLKLTSHRSYPETQKAFLDPENSGNYSPAAAATDLVRFSTMGAENGRMNLAKEGLSLFADGSLWPFLDGIIQDGENRNWISRLPLWQKVIEDTYADNGAFLRVAPSLMATLRETATSPISCMRGTTSLQTLSPEKVFEETSRLGLHSFLNLLFLNTPFCEFPRPLISGAQTLLPLATSESSDILTHWLQLITREPHLFEFFIAALSENNSRLAVLAPLMKELTLRNALTPAFLNLSAIKIEDRRYLQNHARTILNQEPELQGSSILEIITNALPRLEAATLTKLLLGGYTYLESEKPLLQPALSALRKIYFINDSHPMVDMALETLADAENQKKLLSGFFHIAERHEEEFQAVIQELSQMMRKEDGRFENIAFSMFTLFKSHMDQSAYALNANETPALAMNWRHGLTVSEIPTYEGSRPRPTAYNRCRSLDLSFSIDSYSAPEFTEQFSSFANCVALYENGESWERGLNFLASASAPVGALLGRSLFSYAVETTRSFSRSLASISEGTHLLLTSIADRRLPAFFSGVSSWYQEGLFNHLVSLLQNSVPSFRPFTYIFENIRTSEFSKRQWLTSQRSDVCYYNIVFEEDEDTGDMLPRKVYTCENLPLLEAISKQLSIWEPSADVRIRTEEIISDFLNEKEHDFTSLEEKRSQANHLKRTLSKETVITSISEVYGKLYSSQTTEEDPRGKNTHKALHGLTKFLKSLNPSMNGFVHEDHYSKEDLKKVGRKLSEYMIGEANRLQVIPYYYLGETTPKIRLVSGLDRLALILLNSDFELWDGLEPGVIGLGGIPQSWLDEPRSTWPPYIDRNGPTRNRIFTLANVTDILLSGVPSYRGCAQRNKPLTEFNDKEKTCYSRLMNLKNYDAPHSTPEQMIHQPPLTSLFHHYLPTDNICNRDALDCFGIKVVRNLFSSIWNETPLEFRTIMDSQGAYLGKKTNLKIMNLLMRTGVFRKVTLQLLGKDIHDRELEDFFQTSVILANHPEFEKLLPLLEKIIDGSETGPWNVASTNKGLTQSVFEELYDLSDSNTASEIGFYLVAGTANTGLLEAPHDVFMPVVRAATGIFGHADSRKLLLDNISVLKSLLDSAYNLSLTKTLYSDSANPQGHLQSTLQSLDRARTHSSYPTADLSRLIESMVSFLEHPPLRGEENYELYMTVTKTLLTQMKNREPEAILETLARNPEEARSLLNMLGELSHQGKVQDILSAITRLLNDPRANAGR